MTVKAAVASALGVGRPRFTVCPSANGASCSVGSLAVGQADELQVSVKVGQQAGDGEHVQLTARATGSKEHAYSDYATDLVTANPGSATGTSAGSPGGVTLPPVTLPPLSGTGGVSPGDPSGLFPTIAPAPTGSTGTSPIGLPVVKPHKKGVRVAEVAATVPLDSRLIGGQLAGLAVLIGAVVLAITRLSLRSAKPAETKGDAKPAA